MDCSFAERCYYTNISQYILAKIASAIWITKQAVCSKDFCSYNSAVDSNSLPSDWFSSFPRTSTDSLETCFVCSGFPLSVVYGSSSTSFDGFETKLWLVFLLISKTGQFRSFLGGTNSGYNGTLFLVRPIDLWCKLCEVPDLWLRLFSRRLVFSRHHLQSSTFLASIQNKK